MSEQKSHQLLILCFFFDLIVTISLLFLFPVFGIFFLLLSVLCWILFFSMHRTLYTNEKSRLDQKISVFKEKLGFAQQTAAKRDFVPEYQLVSVNEITKISRPVDKETFVIGRDADCDFVLSSFQTVGRHHCRILYRKYSKEYYIEDLRSLNGTYLGTRRLDPFTQEKLLENTTLTIGHHSFQFVKL